jgi:protein phosphatase
VLAGLRAALEPLWSELDTGWVLLDCELMPWSAEAGELLRQQYAPVGQAARMGISAARVALEQAGLQEQAARLAEREDRVQRYDAAWRRYCWAVRGPEDLQLAPFHLLASEGAVHTDKDHLWHLSMLSRLQGPGIRATPHLVVCPDDPQSVQAGVDWWWEKVRAGAEGMVVKPRSFLPPDGRLQPALKVRGPEYLRIIYGPEYDLPEHLPRLRERNLGGKRALAQREFALGVEGLERFTRRAGLRAVHQCVAAVLALESEPVDPRL